MVRQQQQPQWVGQREEAIRGETARGEPLALLHGLAESALERQESRGTHYRKDFPETDEVNCRRQKDGYVKNERFHGGKVRGAALG